ncbi:MAG: hypothetical protein ACJ8AY_06705 [Gemmatimonadales bacterium]
MAAVSLRTVHLDNPYVVPLPAPKARGRIRVNRSPIRRRFVG